MTQSAIYEGTIRHRRNEPRREFTHRIAMAYVDLDELPALLGGRLVARRPGLVRFRRRDYFGDPTTSLEGAVRGIVEDRIGVRPDGPIRVLTQLRSFGHCFNPVSFYYCFDATGERLLALVAEVTNTPWGERHAYVVRADQAAGSVLGGELDKAMHVSPFMKMNLRYAVRASAPSQSLSVHIVAGSRNQTMFDATLSLKRRQLSRRSLRVLTARYPLASGRVLALIYIRAVMLRLAGVRVHPHPRRELA